MTRLKKLSHAAKRRLLVSADTKGAGALTVISVYAPAPFGTVSMIGYGFRYYAA